MGAIALLAVMAIAMTFAFTACGETMTQEEAMEVYSGTYKFVELTTKINVTGYGKQTITAKIGETVNGINITENYTVIELRKDGTCSLSSDVEAIGNASDSEWRAKGNKIIIDDLEEDSGKPDFMTFTVTIKGSIMTLVMDIVDDSDNIHSVFTLKKV